MSLSSKIFHGMAWSAIERFAVQLLQFVVGIILARILTPAEYGVLGILLVFIAISNVFIDSGFTKALIQKQQRTATDISTVFLFNLGISLLCYILLFGAAPWVSHFYEIGQLTPLLRVMALSLVINALVATPITLITIELDFKTLTKINLVAATVSGITAIYMAYDGYGVWALVVQTLIRSVFKAVLGWKFASFSPTFNFSYPALQSLFKYGSNLLVGSLLNTTVNNIYSLLIPKYFDTQKLGYYSRGTQFTDVFFNILNAVFQNVLLPGLSTIQDQQALLIQQTRNIIKATTIIAVPLFFTLAAIAKPLILVLLTDKWLPAVPIMQIFCMARLITLVSGINVNLLYVIGRTDLALRQQYAKIAIRVLFLLLALPHGILYIALAELLATVLHFFINTHYPGKIMSYGALRQIGDTRLIVLAGGISMLAMWSLQHLIQNNYWYLFIAVLVGTILYFSLLRLFKVKEMNLLLEKALQFARISKQK